MREEKKKYERTTTIQLEEAFRGREEEEARGGEVRVVAQMGRQLKEGERDHPSGR